MQLPIQFTACDIEAAGRSKKQMTARRTAVRPRAVRDSPLQLPVDEIRQRFPFG